MVGAAGELEVREYHNVRYLLRPGKGIEHQFFVKPVGTETLRLDGFCQQWRAELLESDGGRLTLHVPASGTVWLRLLGMQPALKVRIETVKAGAAMAEILVRIEPVRCSPDAAARLLEETGPDLLESLRGYLQALPERRNQARLPFEQTVRVLPVPRGPNRGEAVICQAKDISMRGMGLTMPCRPPSMRIRIRLSGDPPSEEVAVPACVVRARAGGEGRLPLRGVGVRFLVEEGPPRG